MVPMLSRTLACALLSLPVLAAAAPESALTDAGEALERLRANAGGDLLQRFDRAGAYTQLRAGGQGILLQDNVLAAPVERAFNFLSLSGAALGVSEPLAQLRSLRVSRDAAGNQHVHLEQMQSGLPVFGARLVVHMNSQGIYGVNGVFVPGLEALDSAPQLGVGALRDSALRAAQKLHPGESLEIESTRLMFYRSGLLEGHEGRNYLAYEALVRNAAGGVREQLILNAHDGALINRINRVHSVLKREVYTPNQDVPPVLTETTPTPVRPADPPLVLDNPAVASTRTADTPVNNLFIFAGGTYALYKNLFGREGYDDGDTAPEAQVQKSVYLINDQCPNAYWNGDSTNYCPGFDADDVVSHEWSHAYTEYTHGLVYQYQSGALNESYSDIFGEVYDLVNGLEGPLGATFTEGDYYENGGSRFLVGEDLSQAGAELLLRDMWDPDSFPVSPIGNPYAGRVISDRYYCGTGDGGGVHINSAVPNHAFAMLVDGKEYNGVTIPAIGMTKATQIYFQASSTYQTPTTNFAQHADALEQSCEDLIGVPLNDVTGAVSAERITAADCDAVRAAILSVQFRQSPKEQCGYQPVLAPEAVTPSACAAGKFETPDYSETWEGGAIPAGWTVTPNVTGDTSENINWTVTADLPAPHTGKAAFMANTKGGSCAAGGDISGSFLMDSPEITVTDGASYLKFEHFMQSEAEFDGGNIKYSINGAAFALVPATAFDFNPYNDALADAATLPAPDPTGIVDGNNTNPMGGQAAWTGSDQGESFSSWGTSIVNLGTLGAVAGDKIRFRFEFGQDGCNGNRGWYVDDLAVLHCSSTPPPVVVPPVITPVADTVTDTGRFGSGALGLGLLLPLLLARRRRR